ncbi:tripartite tricarboxylate transporter permease [Sinorhizobium meliloti]|uniref:Transporter n=1 Tax=Rhizobium meliloti TaxID=382 RepID=A0A2J0YYS6_RHIML|nr:tripartite tricarboxylate transporter permease [Sinorhizobium meliloti]PJR13430.1 transporter [Sinorhizobium meliloti]
MENLLLGLGVALTPFNLLMALIGATIGTAIGVLPGLGPVATISILMPVTFQLEPASAIIMLCGIYLGAMYGGSITSILVNVPGEAASVVTCLDGHQMAKNGRAGAALGIAAFGSFTGGIIATFGLIILAPMIPQLTRGFGPPEYAMLVLAGLLLVTQVGNSGTIRSIIMAFAGLLLATVGTDPISGEQRFTFGRAFLTDGIGIVPLAIGLFGVSELLSLALQRDETRTLRYRTLQVRELFPSKEEWRLSIPAIGRGSGLGFLLGLLPGAGMSLVSFVTYAIEKSISKTPEKFGKGAIEGVAAPETANNAGSQAAFAPMLSLGLPSSPTMGVIMGALMVHGVAVGPQLISRHPDVFWGVLASMLVSNILLIILNVPLISIFVRLLRVPYTILVPMIMLFVVLGAYTIDNRIEDVWMTLGFGVVGFVLRRYGFDPAPMVLAYVLGGIFERSFRQSLILGDGPGIFFDRPVSSVLTTLCIVMMVVPLVRTVVKLRKGRSMRQETEEA